MGKKKTKKEQPKSWWQKLLCELIGLSLIIFPLLIYISLISYNADDPSFNKAASDDVVVKNWLGSFGSYSADFVLSSFGLAFIIYLLVPILWGLGLVRFQAFAEYKMRIFAWIVGLLCFSAFLDLTCSSFLGRFNLPYNLTGEWSRSLSRPLNNYINMLNFSYNTILLESIVLFISILSFNFAAGITFTLWLRLTAKIGNLLKNCSLIILNLSKRIANIRNFSEFKEINPRYLQDKLLNKNHLPPLNRVEPSFGQASVFAKPQSLNTVSSQQTAAAPLMASAQNSGLKIEIPQANTAQTIGNLAIETGSDDTGAISSSFSPTFDFIKDGDFANQNVKKPSKKITPEDIYQTEGARSFASKATKSSPAENIPQQEELLTIPTAAASITAPLQAQQPSVPNSQKPAEKITPTPVPNFNDTSTPASKIAQPAAAANENEYQLPDINLLSIPQDNGDIEYDEATLQKNAVELETVLKDFGIKGKIVKVRPGPVVTLYELEPAPGTRTARVIGLSDDIARSMAVASVRMAVVSGHNTIGIELPNEKRQTVWLRELLEDPAFKNSKNILNVTLGKDIGGQHIYADLSKMPHLLVAGTTGSGKSVGVNSMILSLLYRMTPEQCKLIMIDPKQLEFSMYNGIPHLLTPVITDPAKAVVGLKWAVREMEDRYRAMALLNVRNIAGYNQKVSDMRATGKEIKKTIQVGFDKETGRPLYEEQIVDTTPMPYIVIVVDEMADLMLVAGKEVEAAIQRLAQMARAAGIHLIMSTQRPSVDVITGTIKANFPSRISFHVTTKIDSRTILGEQGAEQLLGMGDMLYMPSGLRPIRVHGCFVTDAEVERVVEFIKSEGEPKYVADVTEGELNTGKDTPVFDKGEMGGDNSDDDLYNQAVAIVRADKKASTSYIQRKLRLGYNRAAILIERMEDEGIVTPPDRVGRREVIGAE